MINNYDNLPVGRYLEILTISRDENIEELDKQVKVLSILSDMSEGDLLRLPITEYKQMVKASRFLEIPDVQRHPVAKQYIVGKYTLIPVVDYRKLTTAQYIDFQSFAPKMDDMIAEVVSCFLAPKGMQYAEGYDVLDVQEAIRQDMSVGDAVTLMAFFLTSLRQSIEDSLNFCRRELKKLKKKGKPTEELEKKVKALEDLLTNGDGLQMLM